MAASQSKAELLRLRQEFARRYKVRPFSVCGRNIYEVFRTGNCILPGKKSHWEDTFQNWVSSSPLFDHLEVWGWVGRAVVLVGHPYPDNISEDDGWLLDEMRRYRLEIQIHGTERSYYGNGSIQYLAFASGFLNMVGSPDPEDFDFHEPHVPAMPKVLTANEIVRRLAAIPGIREGLTTSQILECVESDPQHHVELRETIMGWSYGSHFPSVKSVGRRLRSVHFEASGSLRLTSVANPAKSQVWKVEGQGGEGEGGERAEGGEPKSGE